MTTSVIAQVNVKALRWYALAHEIDPYNASLLRAHAHRWGAGKTHLWVKGSRPGTTCCGKSERNCPGLHLAGSIEDINCISCMRVIESEWRLYDPVERAKRQKEALAQSVEWWDRYNAYLRTAEWRTRRAQVLRRASYICEFCRVKQATQVHHLSYEHVGQEPLEDLTALCLDCHRQAHPYKEDW